EIPAAVVPGIARICALGLGLDELLGETCREIVALCGVDACYLVSYRERGAALGNLRAHGILAADDVLALPPDDPVRALHEPHSVRSLLLAPLKFGSGVVGLLALHGYGSSRKWGRGGGCIAGGGGSHP